MQKLLLTLSLLVIFLSNSNAQSYKNQQNEILAYNILSSGLMGGIGGAINRDEGEKWHKAFFKNFGKACLGGLIKYQAKYNSYNLRYPQNTNLIIPNRLHYFIGHSIVMNASYNKKMWDTYYANIWGMDIRINTNKNPEKRIQARLSLGTVANALSFAIDGHKFNLQRSIEYGHLTFDYDTSVTYYGRNDIRGLGGYNVTAFRLNDFNKTVPYEVVPHELVHNYQHYDLYYLSSWYKKRTKHLYEDLPIYKKLKNHVLLDYEPLFNALAYAVQPKPTYFRNFYEYEAEHFNSRYYLQR